MTRNAFISVVLAAALAVTGFTSSPAVAGNDGVKKFIAGAAALAIIGAVVADQNKKKRKSHAHVATRNHGFQQGHHGGFKTQRKHHKQYGHKQHGHHKRAHLPARCQTQGYTQHGTVYGFGRHCLLKSYSHFNALPHKCAVNALSQHGKHRVIYHGQCLQQSGFRVAHR